MPFGKEPPEAKQERGEPPAGDDERHGHQYQRDAEPQPRRKFFVENHHAEEDRRDGFERTEDGRRRGADVVDGLRGAEQRNGRRQRRQRQHVAPQIPRRDGLQAREEIEPHDVDRKAEQQGVEGELDRRQGRQRGAVDAHDIDGVGKRREQHERHAREAERLAVSLVEQPDA